MSIVVTPGETALLNAFSDAGIDVLVENLLVGDAHIRRGDDTVYIFERKATSDLLASIKDGRYREQKSRLLETGIPRKNIVYIIEKLTKPLRQDHVRVWSAICNSQHRDGFTVFKTNNIVDTMNYLVGMASTVEQFTAGEGCKLAKVHVNIKKRQVAQEDWFKYSLTLIPKCSLSIAQVITNEYPTISSLIDGIDEHGTGCLGNLKHGTSQRRIGEKLSNEICETVLMNY